MLRTRREAQLLATTWVPLTHYAECRQIQNAMGLHSHQTPGQASDEDSSGQGLRQRWERLTEIFWNKLEELELDLEEILKTPETHTLKGASCEAWG